MHLSRRAGWGAGGGGGGMVRGCSKYWWLVTGFESDDGIEGMKTNRWWKGDEGTSDGEMLLEKR